MAYSVDLRNKHFYRGSQRAIFSVSVVGIRDFATGSCLLANRIIRGALR